MARYKYYTNGNQVICVSSYAKIPVKGVAKCSPEDVFNGTCRASKDAEGTSGHTTERPDALKKSELITRKGTFPL